jgi:predicted kinase
MTLKITICVGIPGSGKSFWTKQEIAKSPNDIVRVNNDDLRNSFNGSIWSKDYEKIIVNTRKFVIAEALRNNKNVIVDNLNIGAQHWKDITKIAKASNKDVIVEEKLFYVDLETAIIRDSGRSGKACVGEKVVRTWWNKSGKESFKNREPRTETFIGSKMTDDRDWKPIIQDKSLPKAVIFDNDGTISLVHKDRNPYDASTCNLDYTHDHVIECMKLYHEAGYKILFVSGREEKDRVPTELFYKKHFPNIKYELYMRPTADRRQDVLIKEEIYNNHIKNNYYVSGWFDDRLQIVKWLYSAGFPLFRVGNPESDF